jgi:hypothetical protein
VIRLWFAAIAVLAALLIVGAARAHNVPNSEHNRRHAITYAFCHTLRSCPLGREALNVAYCESGPNLWPYARNGQYLGMFQAGAWMRSRFGFSWSPWVQARAAYRYWLESGWSGWSCA